MHPSLVDEFFIEEGASDDFPRKLAGIAIDSRLVSCGDLFFALPGERTDGHLFISAAKKNGAIAVVVKKGNEHYAEGLPFLAVEDVTKTLQTLAKKFLLKKKVPVVGITGSLGKTTVKGFINELLGLEFPILVSPKNYNTSLSLPMVILTSRGDERFFVLEMGIRQPNDFDLLLDIVPSTVAVLTGLAPQHALFFPEGLEGVIKEKLKIFSSPLLTTALFPLDSQYAERCFKATAHIESVFTFAYSDPQASFTFAAVEKDFVIIKCPTGTVRMPVQFSYKPAYYNFLIAFSTAFVLGVSPEKMGQYLAQQSLALPPMRFEQIQRNGILFINDAYNAMPESMIAAIEAMPQPSPLGKRMAILAQINELGNYKKQGHRKVFSFACKSVDHIIFIGPFWIECCQDLINLNKKVVLDFFTSREEAIIRIKELLMPGDVVLLKGSRAFELEKVLEAYEIESTILQ